MAHKLLLLKDVDGLGRQGDVVTARPGYIRNFLLPQGLAIVANDNALRKQAQLQEERQKLAQIDKQKSEELAQQLQALTLTKIVKIDQEGHMYGSVSALDIVNLLQDQSSIALEKRNVVLPQPIKEVGVFTINVKLKEGVASTLVLKVVPEEVPASHQPPAKKQPQEKQDKQEKQEK